MNHPCILTQALFLIFLFPLTTKANMENVTSVSNNHMVTTGAISGNVFNDSDGLLDSSVDGSAISEPDMNQLYAILYDNDNSSVLDFEPITAGGTYIFSGLASYGDYGVAISINSGVIGNPLPEIELPTNWYYTGDKLGTGPGSDGSPDGDQYGISVGTTEVSNVNFGIEKRPVADGHTFDIVEPAPNSFFVIGSAGTENLSGEDFEDGILGSGDDFGITILPSDGNEMYYNGLQITFGDDGVSPPSDANPFTMSNYNPALLEIKFLGGSETSTSFKYVTFDAAGVQSKRSTYKLNYNALPVEWAVFQVTKSDIGAEIYFATLSESNSSHFFVQKSYDGVDFRNIHTFEAQGNSTTFVPYVHKDPLLNLGMNYYRILQVDLDGTIDYTPIKSVIYDVDQSTLVYPNPMKVGQVLNLKFHSAVEGEQIIINNMLGHEVKRISSENILGWNIISIDVSDLPVGMYSLKIGKGTKVKMFNITE